MWNSTFRAFPDLKIFFFSHLLVKEAKQCLKLYSAMKASNIQLLRSMIYITERWAHMYGIGCFSQTFMLAEAQYLLSVSSSYISANQVHTFMDPVRSQRS